MRPLAADRQHIHETRLTSNVPNHHGDGCGFRG
jgi:hypothetical protein